MTLFVSVDVETSGPSPALADLLTLGAVPVLSDGTVLDEFLYVRLDHGRPLRWEPACRAWWEGPDSSDEAKRCAYGEHRPSDAALLSPRVAALTLEAWLVAMLEQYGATEAAFVGHPACFDWMFVADLLWTQIGRNPFGYRALCLRSMGYGLSDLSWVEDRTDAPDLHVSSELPHHALHDAIAQAHQLSRMLKLRAARGR